MDKIIQHNLGPAAWEFVRRHLGDTNVFCSALLKTVNAVEGEVYTLAPSTASEEQLTHFEWGGLLFEKLASAQAVTLPDGSTLVPVVSLVKDQAKLLRQAVLGNNPAICIVDDYYPRWSDLASQGTSLFGVGEEVYHLLSANDDEAAFVGALRERHVTWHGVAAVCGAVPQLDHTRASTASELERCAAAALLFTCAAYDGEGFVAWRRLSK